MKPSRDTEPCCVYCGDWFQCRDHVTPNCWLRVYRDYSLGKVVSCCNQCNTLAGAFLAFSVCDKAEHLIERYTDKFRKVLELPEWNAEDIATLDHGLRDQVQANQNLKELIYAKLDNLRLVAAGFAAHPVRVVF